MNEPQAMSTSNLTGAEPRGQLREWVTPTFEKIALKDALGTQSLQKWTMADFVTHSS